jgi:hypothetical protein
MSASAVVTWSGLLGLLTLLLLGMARMRGPLVAESERSGTIE